MTTHTIGSAGGRDYSSITAWNAAAGTLSAPWIGNCYNDSEFHSSETFPITFTGNSTTSSNYILLQPATGQSFADNANAQTNALTYNQSNGVGIRSTNNYVQVLNIEENYVTLNKLQVQINSGNGNASLGLNGVYSVTVTGCILSSKQTNNSGSNYCINAQSSSASASPSVIANTLCEVIHQGGSNICALQNGVWHFYFCTIVNASDLSASSYGIYNNYNNVTVENCAIFGCTTAAHAGGTLTVTTSMTNQASAPTGFTTVTYTSQFVGTTSSSPDWREKSGGNLQGSGTADSTNGAYDIVGTARPQGSNWDIGCWQQLSAGETGTGVLTFAGISMSAAGTAAAPGTGILAFSGISISAAGYDQPTGEGALAFSGLSISGTATAYAKTQIFLSGSTLVMPLSWNSDSNIIHVIGGGQKGSTSSDNGGAGGHYANLVNFGDDGGDVQAIQIGASGSPGQDTWFSSDTTLLAAGGASSSTDVGETTYAGGAGGAGTDLAGGGGGGAAGPNGAGVAGSAVVTTGVGANGGAGDSGIGGAGGAGGAIHTPGTAGSPGEEWTDNSGGPNNGLTVGPGGGGGGGGSLNEGGAGGDYGAGGGGNYVIGGAGTQGLIVLQWNPAAGTETGTGEMDFSGISMSGAGAGEVVGTVTLAFSGISISASGYDQPTGIGNLAFTGIAFSAAGAMIVTGTATLAFNGISISGAGYDQQTGSGSLAFSGISIAASGYDQPTGVGNLAFSGITVSASGTDGLDVFGTGTLAFSGISISASGYDQPTGEGDLAFSGISMSAAGAASVTGTGILTFSGISISGAGALVQPTGTGSLAFSGIAFSAAGAIDVQGTGTLIFQGISFSAAGRAKPIGSGVLVFAGVTFIGSGADDTGVLGTGTLAFNGITIIGLGYNVGVVGSGLRQFWTFQ